MSKKKDPDLTPETDLPGSEINPAGGEPDLSELDALKNDFLDMTDKLLRTAAEFDNYRKRTEREKQQSISYGTCLAVERLLPVLDNLERAACAACTDAEYKKGVDLTVESFRTALKALGVEELEAENKPFDPAIHCAVSREAADAESGTVVRVLQKGYKLGDRVIRHSMVVVAE